MRVDYHKHFVRAYSKRIKPYPRLNARFRERLKLFLVDPHNPVLKDHKLVGKESGYRAFSVGGDIRVVYRIEGQTIWLYDIGSHNQVY